jgi:hypothetical protein
MCGTLLEQSTIEDQCPVRKQNIVADIIRHLMIVVVEMTGSISNSIQKKGQLLVRSAVRYVGFSSIMSDTIFLV